MFRKVIVGYDGSESAQDALALAGRLRDHAGELLLAGIYPVHQLAGRLPALRVAAEAHAETTEVMLAAAAEALVGEESVTQAIGSASPARGLAELTERESPDLLVIGSSRHAAEGRVRLGRVAQRLLHGAPCPVAVAPRGLHETEDLHHIGVAYDGSAEAEAALELGFHLAADQHAALTLYCAVAPDHGVPPLHLGASEVAAAARDVHDWARGLLRAAADRAPAGVNPETLLLEGSPAQAITERADRVLDVLLVGARSYGFAHRVLLGSESEGLLNRATFPVIVVPRGDRPGVTG